MELILDRHTETERQTGRWYVFGRSKMKQEQRNRLTSK